MDLVYLITVQIIFILVLINYFSQFYVGILYLCFSLLLGIILKKKESLFYVIPFIFFVRNYTAILNKKIFKNDIIKIEMILYEGKGEIKKINEKYSIKKNYAIINNLKNGNYEIIGLVEDIKIQKEYNEYKIKVLEEKNIKEIKKNIIEENLEKRIDKILKNSNNGQRNLFKAVVLGIKEPIYKKVRNLFVKTGTAHLLAISGLHIGILVIIITKILSYIKLNKRERNIGTLILISVYFIGVRGSPSVQRAFIMALICIIGKIVNENSELSKSLCISFIISLLIEPTGYKNASFIMSYYAIFSILLMNPILIKLETKTIILGKYINKLCMYILFTVVIQILMFPITYIYFGKIDIKNILYNLIITPIGTIYIISCFISIFFSPFIKISNIVYEILIKVMEYII